MNPSSGTSFAPISTTRPKLLLSCDGRSSEWLTMIVQLLFVISLLLFLFRQRWLRLVDFLNPLTLE